jgi:hypothetical protein
VSPSERSHAGWVTSQACEIEVHEVEEKKSSGGGAGARGGGSLLSFKGPY